MAAAGTTGALLFTKSRGGYLGLLVALAVLATPLFRVRGSRRRMIVALAIAAAGVGSLSALVPALRSFERDQWSRAASTFDVEGDPSGLMHLDTWNVGLHIALDHPLTGAGQEMYPELFPGYRDALLSSARARAFSPYRVESPHNVFLPTADGAGFPALALYLGAIAFVIVAVRRALEGRSNAEGALLVALVAVVAGHLVTDAFMTADVTSTWLFWLVLGAGAAVAQRAMDGWDLETGTW
jgi:O-antigen ligase